MIRGNSSLQEKFGDIEVLWGQPPREKEVPNGDSAANGVYRINVIEALLKLALEPSPIHLLDARLAACECINAFFANHSGIRTHVLNRAIDGHLSGQDQIPNILSLLVSPPETRGNADPYQTWIASVLLFHLLFEDSGAKGTAMKVTEGEAEKGEEVITCVQTIAGNLITGIQRGDDERISIGYLMLLCGWLFEEPDAVNDFLGEGSSIQSLLQETRHRSVSNVLVPGLCTILLGILYEFSSKDSPIPRRTIHKLLVEQLGREQYIDKITKFRACPFVRDYEVLPQTAVGQFDGGLPDIFFDRTFIEFLKDNFSRLVRSIDREPGLEISVITNGLQKGISREMVDSLRSDLDERNQAVQKLESDLLTLQQKLEQEQFSNRQMRESNSSELSKIEQTNEARQREHEEQLSKLDEEHKHAKNELLRQHGEQLRAIDNQLKETSAEYDQRSQKMREHHEAEVADLQQKIRALETELGKAKEDHADEVAVLNQTVQNLQSEIDSNKKQHEIEVANLKGEAQVVQSELDKLKQSSTQDLQGIHDEYKAKQSALEKRAEEAESKTERTETLARKTTGSLKEAREENEKVKSEAKEKEEARQAAQSELDDLLIVFADLEAKRTQDKVSHVLCTWWTQLTARRNASKSLVKKSRMLKTTRKMRRRRRRGENRAKQGHTEHIDVTYTAWTVHAVQLYLKVSSKL